MQIELECHIENQQAGVCDVAADAISKAKAFYECHQLTSNASSI